MSNERIRYVQTEFAIPLQELLVQSFLISLEQAEHLLGLGAIYVDKMRVRENITVPAGSTVRAHLMPRRYLAALQMDWRSRIVSITDNYLIVDKPSAIPIHPTLDNYLETTSTSLERHLGESLYVTGRLDIGTEGLCLLARTKEFQRFFNNQLRDGRVHKIYSALTRAPLECRRWTHYMFPGERAPRMVQRDPAPGFAVCQLEVIHCTPVNPIPIPMQTNDPVFQSRIQLITGRTHQIRTQLAAEGAPIIGDVMYENLYHQPQPRPEDGSMHSPGMNFNTPDRFALACSEIEFQNQKGCRESFRLSRPLFSEFLP